MLRKFLTIATQKVNFITKRDDHIVKWRLQMSKIALKNYYCDVI